MNKKISPFKDVPLRQAGDSLFSKRTEIILDEILSWITISFVIGVITLSEWLRLFLDTPPQPIRWTVIFICILLYSIYKYFKIEDTLSNYDLGLMGEKLVAETLNKLQAYGYHIIHDLPLEKMNIDHILVGPAGIFTIETKSVRKTMNQKSVITHIKKDILINGKRSRKSQDLWQAQKEADSLRDILITNKGICPPIQPIVVYPQWYVIDDCEDSVWVLNDKYLVEKIRYLPVTLSPKIIASTVARIEAYARKEISVRDYKRK